MPIVTDPARIEALEDKADAQGPRDWSLWKKYHPGCWAWGATSEPAGIDTEDTLVETFHGTWREARAHFDKVMERESVARLGNVAGTRTKHVRGVHMTVEERAAIDALKRLAKKWPKTLTLVQHCDSTGTIKVVRTADIPKFNDSFSDLSAVEGVERINLRVEVCT